jgi:hypothetical protein
MMDASDAAMSTLRIPVTLSTMVQLGSADMLHAEDNRRSDSDLCRAAAAAAAAAAVAPGPWVPTMQQNDIDVIAGQVGFAPVPTGIKTSTAVDVPVTVYGSKTYTASIAAALMSTSPHMYKFTASAGSVTISADVAANWGTYVRANDDLLVTLYSPTGAPMSTMNPPGIAAPIGLGVGPTSANLPSAGT